MSTFKYLTREELLEAARNLLTVYRARLGVLPATQAGMLITARFTGMAELARSTGLTTSVAWLEVAIADVVLELPPPAFDVRAPEADDVWLEQAAEALAVRMNWLGAERRPVLRPVAA